MAGWVGVAASFNLACPASLPHSPAGLLETAHLNDTLERVDASALTLEDFVQRYERPRRPVMLTGLCAGWRAAEEWTPGRLLARLGDCKFKVGGVTVTCEPCNGFCWCGVRALAGTPPAAALPQLLLACAWPMLLLLPAQARALTVLSCNRPAGGQR